MNRSLHRIGMCLALYAALVLTLPSCSGVDEIWVPETVVEEQPIEDTRATETARAGKLQITLTRKIRAVETPVERLYLRHTESTSGMTLETFSLAFFSILGGILSVGLYFLIAFAVVSSDKDD